MELIDFLFAKEQLFITAILASLLALLLANLVADKLRIYQIIDVNEAVALMDDKTLTVLDVRHQKERKDGYINKDTHIPLAMVKDKLNSLNKDGKILVYCHSGSRSAYIAKLLSRNQFSQIYCLKGGIKAWKKANLPIKIA